MAAISIYLTNLGKYNEGELVGEWLELPASDEEIAETLERIGISDEPDENGRFYEEYFITDYETEVDGLKIGEYDNIDELNALAEAVEGNEQTAAALIYFGYNTAEEIGDHIDDVMYITTPEGAESEDFAVGYYYAEECGCLEIPENLKNYFDYEAYGRDIMLDGSFYIANDGAIYEMVA